MKTIDPSSLRIVGVRAVDMQAHFFHEGLPAISVTFSLKRDDDADLIVAHSKKSWSERVYKALKELQDAIETDGVPEFYKDGVITSSSSEESDYPPSLGDQESKQI